jgi:ADP-ribose pyrophosphatase YjhB (NUDIX family)
VCPNCANVHYVNPRIVVGTIPVYEDGPISRVLLCKRAIEPRHGFWTLPAGFMEVDETMQDGAERETWEEAQARVIVQAPFTMLDVKSAQQMHIFFRARLETPSFAAGTESLEVRLFAERDIPWDELAFKTVSKTLELYFADRQQGFFRLHTGDLHAPHSWSCRQFSQD